MHKVLIGGTSYDIKGGKTLIGGTSYDIKGGRTLIGGTGYPIKFDRVPREGLVHEYLFDGDLKDNLSTDPYSGPGIFNAIYGFEQDSQGQYFRCKGITGSNPMLSSIGKLPVNFTLSFWIKDPQFNLMSSGVQLEYAAGDIGVYIVFGWQYYFTTEQWTIGASAAVSVASGPSNSVERRTTEDVNYYAKFAHIALSLGPEQLKLYVDNKVHSTYSPGSTGPVWIKALPSQSAVGVFKFNNYDNDIKIDNLRIYNRQLSDAEVAQLYNGGIRI